MDGERGERDPRVLSAVTSPKDGIDVRFPGMLAGDGSRTSFTRWDVTALLSIVTTARKSL